MKIDYSKIGFRAGIEIHQRLDTKKLFCNCNSDQKNEPNIKIIRKLRPVAGEMGDIDPAAVFEFLKNKNFTYLASPEESCLVEADESPPHELNHEALKIGLGVCKMLFCDVPDEIHIMRKTVIDGSNTSGFQRTSVIGLDGLLKTSKGDVGIQTVCLEEESARIENKEGENIVYRLNGLGIPLVEIATSSDIKDPDHVKEVAETLGTLLRSTKVQRGIGTIRQDINISIRDGARIEIKGFQELEKIPKLVENEVKRQLKLLEIKNILNKRAVSNSDFVIINDVTEVFKNTKCNFVRKAVSEKSIIHAAILPRFSGLLKEVCGDRTLGKELSSYAAAYGLGIIHTDEDLEKYKLTFEFNELRKKLDAKQEDLVLIVIGKSPEIEKALKSVVDRAKQMLIGVPEETRIADREGSKFTRPLPGGARMYPETDVPSIIVNRTFLDSIKIPKSLLEKQKEFEKELPKQLAEQIIKSHYISWYESMKKYDPVLVANTITNTFKMLSRDGYDIEKIRKDSLNDLFRLIKENKIPKEALEDGLKALIEGKPIGYVESRYKTMDDKQLRQLVKDTIRKNPGQKESVLMGYLMKQLKGTVSGEKLIKIIREEMK